MPLKTPGRKPGPDHPRIRVNAGPAPERFDSAGNGIGRETNPLCIIEIAGRMDDSANYLPLIERERVLAHLFVDDAKTLLFDLLPCFNQPLTLVLRPSGGIAVSLCFHLG